MHTILNKNGYLIKKNEYNTEIIKKIKNDLTVSPELYYNNKKTIKFTVYQENEDYIIIPKFYGLKNYGIPNINNEISGDSINVSFNGELRPAQNTIINKIIPYLKEHNGGILCLPCASGKTVLALYLITYFKVKTLIIVHKSFLLNQWIERANEFTNAKIGIIQQNTIDINNKDIVIGMLQSIAKNKYDSNIFNDFGMVIFDEAHHAPSQYFSKALPLINSKISVGLSATPNRTDKLEKILFWYFGDIMYKTENKVNNIIIAKIYNYNIEHEKFKEFKLKSGDINRPLTINKITTIGRRNKFIIDILVDCLKENNKRKIIVLSDRIEHLKRLCNRLNEYNITTTNLYIGGMKNKDLKISEQAQVIFASYSMAAEGLDIPDLNTLFMVTPRKEVEQSVGRIIRKINPDIIPHIYDFVDELPSFINQARCRKRFYKKENFKIINYNVIDNKIINNNNEINNNNNNSEINDDNHDFID
jgi:superfamily II DNA or RNA helicase